MAEETTEVTEEEITETEEAPSIGDELRDAIAAAEEPVEVPADDAEDEPDGAKVATETPQEIPEKEAAPDEGVAEATGVKAPEHWPTEERETFETLPEEVKQLYLTQGERLHAHHQKRVEELRSESEVLERLKPLDQVIAPYREQLKLQGVNERDVVQQLLAVRASLQQQPQETIKWLGTQFGVDLGNLDDAIDADPTENRLNAIEQQVHQSNQANAQAIQQQRVQAARQTVQTQIDTFSTAKNEDGSLKHPYFDAVTPAMTQLTQAYRAQNQPIDLEKVYQEACWLHPETREKILADRDSTQEANVIAKEKKNLRQRTSRAKRADTTIRSTADTPAKSKLSIRDELSQQWEQAQS
jgi:hypothetical protein